ncbi:NAD(P)/FAD-dependent oxidoreductase [Zhihengliuella sp.]|uniref:NAD(P)/FAD-dependent oxidoreductase n=1 Tax=Zhihengliuella sp. TaxID=1954483 RepID=UPI0028121D06|nr:NAD(P)/FAD-dependent oxidoreductase [Zhihengliuella sp.]
MDHHIPPTATMHHSTEIADVAIIGGGFAGLAAATALGRSLRSVAVLDAGRPRNAASPAAHNVLANDGAAPSDLLAAARSDAEKYGVHFRQAEVTAIRRLDLDGDLLGTDDARARFALVVEDGDGRRELRARRILLATGLHDELPDVPGLAEHWGTQVLHCPYCHGWEVRGQRIGVVGTHPMATHQALLFAQLSRRVSLIAHAVDLTSDQRAEMAAAGVEVVEARIASVSSHDGRLDGVVLADGAKLDLDALTVQSRMLARAELYTALGGELAENPMGEFIETDLRGATAVDGVWAAGNSSNLAANVAHAAADGVTAGAALNMDLIQEDLTAALSAAPAL